jgi:hypothetical protein
MLFLNGGQNLNTSLFFIYDNASTHLKHPENSISAWNMPKNTPKAGKNWGIEVSKHDSLTGKPVLKPDGSHVKIKFYGRCTACKWDSSATVFPLLTTSVLEYSKEWSRFLKNMDFQMHLNSTHNAKVSNAQVPPRTVVAIGFYTVSLTSRPLRQSWKLCAKIKAFASFFYRNSTVS